MSITRRRMATLFVGLVVATAFAATGTAWAHPHQASPAHQGDGQELANEQNHGPYTQTQDGGGQACGGDPAAYGLESAHHGPDSGDRGKADGCYETDSFPAGTDDENPAID